VWASSDPYDHIVKTWKLRENYPDYCSSPESMDRRTIPPLDEEIPGMQILQVISVIRHGARTPWTAYDCWDGYKEDPTQSQWDCDFTSVMAPPKKKEVEMNGNFLFEKVYDGLRSDLTLTNELGGDCLLGQLVEPGFGQLKSNGQHIRKAYIEGPAVMQLFETANYTDIHEESTYFRSDDEERTLMSAEILLSDLFDMPTEQTVSLHTADKPRDILSPETLENTCQRLVQLRVEAELSSEYIDGKTSDNAEELTQMMEEMSSSPPMHQLLYYSLDCQMTAICSDRYLPPLINDFISDGDDSNFSRMYEFSTWLYTFHYSYNDGEYAKLAMSHLWFDILRFVNKAATTTSPTDMLHAKIPRFVLFSGHDTTIMPLLVSLGIWDGKWAPYASMWNMELYHIEEPHPNYPSAKAFRIIFNGEVLTDKINGCDSDLCDLNILLKIVEPISSMYLRCDIEAATEGSPNDFRIAIKDKQVVHHEYTAGFVVIISLLSFVLGAVVMRNVGVSARDNIHGSSLEKSLAALDCVTKVAQNGLSYGSIEGEF